MVPKGPLSKSTKERQDKPEVAAPHKHGPGTMCSRRKDMSCQGEGGLDSQSAYHFGSYNMELGYEEAKLTMVCPLVPCDSVCFPPGIV